ncbi:unnamed protein product, partial [Phaeothamnion confervicola]
SVTLATAAVVATTTSRESTHRIEQLCAVHLACALAETHRSRPAAMLVAVTTAKAMTGPRSRASPAATAATEIHLAKTAFAAMPINFEDSCASDDGAAAWEAMPAATTTAAGAGVTAGAASGKSMPAW